jgi:hypothetical protein
LTANTALKAELDSRVKPLELAEHGRTVERGLASVLMNSPMLPWPRAGKPWPPGSTHTEASDGYEGPDETQAHPRADRCHYGGGGLIAPFTMKKEGLVQKPYLDPICPDRLLRGDRGDRGPHLQQGRMRDPHARPHGKGLCSDHHAVPACTGRARAVLGTLIDAGYNAGPGGVCSSPAAQYIRAGNWTKACNALRGWYVTARNRKTGVRVTLPGLVNRRNEEADICLKGSL